MIGTKKAPDATTSGDLEEIQTGHDSTATDGPCASHADIGGVCYHCDPYWRVVREMDESLRERDRKREQERRQAIDEYLTGRYAVYAPSGAALRHFLGVLDRDEVEALEEGDEVETTSDRLLNHAHAEGLLLASDPKPLAADLQDTPSEEWTDEQRERFEAHLDQDPRHVLFVVLDGHTAALLTPEHGDAHPEVRVFPACIGLPPAELSARFHAEGLDLDWFAPTTAPAWTLTADTLEWLTGGPDAVEDEGGIDEPIDPEPSDDLDEDEDEDDDGIDEDTRGALGLLDFAALLSGEPTPFAWLVPGVLGRGLLYQLVAAPKTGKSLLALDLVWRLAAGLDPLPGTELPEGHTRPDEPVTVLYLDAENAPAIVRDRLLEMEAEPGSLSRLHYASYPDLDPLDTDKGAADVLELARHVDAQLVVLDTVSRFVSGNENDSQTYLDLYRRLLMPLKREGRTVVRIDHTGKDPALGARGSSAKGGDVDVSWILTKGQSESRVKLTREFDRTHQHADVLHLSRRQGPLRHEVVGRPTVAGLRAEEAADVYAVDLDDLDDDVRALVVDLDTRNVPSRVGRQKAQETYFAAGGEIKASNNVWSEAVRFRKGRSE